MLNLNKFILFFSFFAFNASAIDFSCVDLEEDEYEFDYSNEKIVSVGKKSVCLIDTKTSKKTEIYKFERSAKAVAKVAISDENVFLNTEDCVFKCLDFSGNVIFQKTLQAVSRSGIFIDNSNVFFASINQYVYCYSKNGDLVWFNKDNPSNDLIYKCKLFVGKYIYLLNKSGISIIDKRTGFLYLAIDKFKEARDFYVVGDDVVCSISDHDFVLYEVMTGVTKKNDNYFPTYFISGKSNYSYKDSVLKNLDNGKEYKFEAISFEFFEGKVFAYNKNSYNYDQLVIIDGEKVTFEKLDFKIRKMIYKDRMFVAFDGSKIYWANI